MMYASTSIQRATRPPCISFSWVDIIFDVSIDFIALFSELRLSLLLWFHVVALLDFGARCFIRIDTASSGTSAYESLGAAADLCASLCCVPWANPQLQNVGKLLHMHIMVRFSVYGVLALTHVCAGKNVAAITE